MSATINTINKYSKPTTGGGDYPDILEDANMRGWYCSDAEYMTMDGSYSVSSWTDRSGVGNITNTGESSHNGTWSADGVVMNINSSLEKNITLSTFTLYEVLDIDDWVNYAYINFFSPDGVPFIYQSGWEENPGGYGITMSAGTPLSTNGVGLGVMLLTFVFNGASSSIRVNGDSPTTGNAGTDSTDTFEFGYSSNTALFKVKEAILRNGADSAGDQTTIRDYLNTKFSVY